MANNKLQRKRKLPCSRTGTKRHRGRIETPKDRMRLFARISRETAYEEEMREYRIEDIALLYSLGLTPKAIKREMYLRERTG